MIDPIAATAGAVAGAIVGSFLVTLILRWPQGRRVARGRSACDGCGRVLGPVDLVPIVSAMMQRGRCRTCGARIDPLHGRVEVGCAIIGALALGAMPGLAGAAWALLGWLLLTLAILDWRHFWLPDALTLPLALLGMTIGLWATPVPMVDRLIGAAAGYFSLLLVSLLYRRMRGRDGLGLGDAKLLGAIGAWFGWQALPFVLLLAAAAGLVCAGGLALAGRPVTGATRLPLGTFLALAALPGAMLAALLLHGAG
ncbi:MAG: A24 family peptidase [Sphingobium sp.]